MIKKYIADSSADGIGRAEAELERMLTAGLPALKLNQWDRP